MVRGTANHGTEHQRDPHVRSRRSESPVPIIAVILMLFSQRAGVNGPMFLLGWVVALGAVSAVVYALSDASERRPTARRPTRSPGERS